MSAAPANITAMDASPAMPSGTEIKNGSTNPAGGTISEIKPNPD